MFITEIEVVTSVINMTLRCAWICRITKSIAPGEYLFLIVLRLCVFDNFHPKQLLQRIPIWFYRSWVNLCHVKLLVAKDFKICLKICFIFRFKMWKILRHYFTTESIIYKEKLRETYTLIYYFPRVWKSGTPFLYFFLFNKTPIARCDIFINNYL